MGEWMSGVHPVFTGLVVQALARPEWVVEVTVVGGAAVTFSLVGRCERTGMFGAVVTSSSPAVAARCAWARAGSARPAHRT